MSMTLTMTTSDANALRIVAALDAAQYRLAGETSRDMVRRYIKNNVTDLVYSHETTVASRTVASDPNLTEVT